MFTPFIKTKENTNVSTLFDHTIKYVNKRKILLVNEKRFKYGDAINEMQLLIQFFINKKLEKGDSLILCLEDDADMKVFVFAGFRYG